MRSIFNLCITFAVLVYNICCAIPAPGHGVFACPPDKPPVECLVSSCQFATCPAYPDAICIDNNCGGCSADFYSSLPGNKVDFCRRCGLPKCMVLSSCDFACLLNYQPVCGSDSVTYGNPCELKRADCKSKTKISVIHHGPCYCLERFEVGNCRGSIPRYYYNSKSRNCEKFFYGGCGGNKNNFQTQKLCESTCKRGDLEQGY